MRILRIRIRELFTRMKGISTPRVRHKGRQPLIGCAKSRLQYLFVFPFLCFLIFGVNKSVTLAPTYPQVR